LAEAAFMTGLWRNADIVDMACYAPLFARVGNVQWAPDLIWFDDAGSFGTPSYYVQQMYARNLPELMAATTVEAAESRPSPLRGRVGVGTWRTQAEFKDIKVVSGEKTLYEFDPDKGLDGWDEHDGQWAVVDGVLRQTSEAQNVRLFAGDVDWSDYTLTLKAKKLAGAEGFLISFAVQNADTPNWWNLGGWNNTLHGLELAGATAQQVPGRIEADRWYDIRIEVKGATAACYLDGKLVQQFEAKPHRTLYAAAGYNEGDQQVVLAVANPTGSRVDAAIETHGRQLAPGEGYVEVLSAADPFQVNSLEQPRAVSPQQGTVTVRRPAWRHEFPPYSFTILKLRTR
jgi:alpha-L-arabinofuranosidase